MARLPRLVLTSRRLVLLAGVSLVTVGIVCLSLSDAVARSGSWWQETLDAFGVGFVIAGVVDVVTVSLLNQILSGSSRESKTIDRAAQAVLDTYTDLPLWDDDRVKATEHVSRFIQEYGDWIDPLLRGRLNQVLHDLDLDAEHTRLQKFIGAPSEPEALD